MAGPLIVATRAIVPTMLEGRRVSLRPVREADLDRLYEAHTAIRSRGAFFPLGVMSEPAFRRDFAENGFWQKTEGMLLIVSAEGEIAGHIESALCRIGMHSSSRTSCTTIAMPAKAT